VQSSAYGLLPFRVRNRNELGGERHSLEGE
jgi:hypothetical protein